MFTLGLVPTGYTEFAEHLINADYTLDKYKGVQVKKME